MDAQLRIKPNFQNHVPVAEFSEREVIKEALVAVEDHIAALRGALAHTRGFLGRQLPGMPQGEGSEGAAPIGGTPGTILGGEPEEGGEQ